MFKLVNKNGESLVSGNQFSWFDRHENATHLVTVKHLEPPHREGTTGRVSVQLPDGSSRRYYASVFGLEFKEFKPSIGTVDLD